MIERKRFLDEFDYMLLLAWESDRADMEKKRADQAEKALEAIITNTVPAAALVGGGLNREVMKWLGS